MFCFMVKNEPLNVYTCVYSYFGKGCRKKCTRQTRKVLWVVLSSLLFKRRAQEAMDVCLRVLKESNKSRFNSYSVRNSVLIISHITFRDCRVHMFSDNLSRNSCMVYSLLCERAFRSFSTSRIGYPRVKSMYGMIWTTKERSHKVGSALRRPLAQRLIP